jgi:hypothetical protein
MPQARATPCRRERGEPRRGAETEPAGTRAGDFLALDLGRVGRRPIWYMLGNFDLVVDVGRPIWFVEVAVGESLVPATR